MTALTPSQTDPSLPKFRYHPDPIATGSVDVRDIECAACGEQRSHAYVGPIYTDIDTTGEICPWCIADGSAAQLLDAEFTDVGTGVPADISEAILDEVAHRTPGFQSWQQDHWLYHCGDACAYLGPVGEQNSNDFRRHSRCCDTNMTTSVGRLRTRSPTWRRSISTGRDCLPLQVCGLWRTPRILGCSLRSPGTTSTPPTTLTPR